MKVFIYPTPAEQSADNGIGRVVHAQFKYLPEHGIDLVADAHRADVIALHTQQFNLQRIDVLHCHGLYWTADPGGQYKSWHNELNARIVEAARRSLAVTVPADWVAESFRRDMRFQPDVIWHGIDAEEWHPAPPDQRGEYLLWNKNRGNADVCDPTPAWEMARRGIPVVTTFAPTGLEDEHMQVIGALSGPEMKRCVEHADVYLATAQETFGVGTLEALAAGVPVLGYAWAGTKDIVRHGIDGFLVSPGDYNGLVRGYEWIKANRGALSDAARQRAKEFTWQAAAAKYAGVYYRVAEGEAQPATAVVITSYNYGRYLAECIESVLAQTVPAAEIVVVDDGSTDTTALVASRYAARIKFIRQENQGVAAARNHGVRESAAPFVVCLDADDRLAPNYLEAVQSGFMTDRGIGICYTGLGMIKGDGKVSENVWEGGFNWEWQAAASLPPHTTIPTAATFRRSMWERVGGYRQQYAPGEDAEFYTRGLAAGFTALRATDAPLIEYRNHGEGAHLKRPYVPIDGDKPWMRDQKYPMAAPAQQMSPVRSYLEPLVSVIMPVAPPHTGLLPRALASVEGQTWRAWELIIVNDTGQPLDAALMRPYPYARVIDTPHAASGAGAARNLGVQQARAPLVVFLDADDELMPDALQRMLRAFTAHEGRYIYTDWMHRNPDQSLATQELPDYDATLSMRMGLHAITVLMARADAAAIQFNETLPAFEDYDFFARCAISGVHGWRLAEALVICDVRSGVRTRTHLAERTAITDAIKKNFEPYITGEIMSQPCCGSGGAAVMAVKDRLNYWETGEVDPQVPAGVTEVRMKFVGDQVGAMSYFGLNGRVYRAGNNPIDRFVNVHPDDVALMKAKGVFEMVQSAPAAQPAARLAPLPVNLPTPPSAEASPAQQPKAERQPSPIFVPMPLPVPPQESKPAAGQPVPPPTPPFIDKSDAGDDWFAKL